MIKQVHSDVVTLRETTADARETFARIWPGAKVEQVVPRSQAGVPTGAGLALVTKPGAKAQLLKLVYIREGRTEKN